MKEKEVPRPRHCHCPMDLHCHRKIKVIYWTEKFLRTTEAIGITALNSHGPETTVRRLILLDSLPKAWQSNKCSYSSLQSPKQKTPRKNPAVHQHCHFIAVPQNNCYSLYPIFIVALSFIFVCLSVYLFIQSFIVFTVCATLLLSPFCLNSKHSNVVYMYIVH